MSKPPKVLVAAACTTGRTLFYGYVDQGIALHQKIEGLVSMRVERAPPANYAELERRVLSALKTPRTTSTPCYMYDPFIEESLEGDGGTRAVRDRSRMLKDLNREPWRKR